MNTGMETAYLNTIGSDETESTWNSTITVDGQEVSCRVSSFSHRQWCGLSPAEPLMGRWEDVPQLPKLFVSNWLLITLSACQFIPLKDTSSSMVAVLSSLRACRQRYCRKFIMAFCHLRLPVLCCHGPGESRGFVKACPTCQKNTPPPREPIQSPLPSHHPWEK